MCLRNCIYTHSHKHHTYAHTHARARVHTILTLTILTHTHPYRGIVRDIFIYVIRHINFGFFLNCCFILAVINNQNENI